MNDDFSQVDFSHVRLLAEVLRLQHWAGGESVCASRIFGLMHGFESTWNEETESFGISREIQRKVEDLLQDVEAGKQSTDGPQIKDRLHTDGVDEMDAQRVMELCCLQSRFTDGLKLVAEGQGSIFGSVTRVESSERDWMGSLHYIELIDGTAGARTKLHAVLSPNVPRVGECITPQRGSTMKVVNVEYVMANQDGKKGLGRPVLIPHVYLEPEDEVDE